MLEAILVWAVEARGIGILQMKITVVCLTSRSGGGLTILQDLFTYATQVDKDNEWQFVISDQDLGTSTSTVEIRRQSIRGGVLGFGPNSSLVVEQLRISLPTSYFRFRI